MSISRGIEANCEEKTEKRGKHVNLEAIKFDDDLEMSVFIPEQQDSIRLVLSDELALADEVMANDYKEKIVHMLGLSAYWYELAEKRIFSELSMTGQLMAIYLLSEQTSSDFIFGLLYRVDAEVEHGRGMKISIEEMTIIDYGDADRAFC